MDYSYWKRIAVIIGFLLFWQAAKLLDATQLFPAPIEVFQTVIIVVTSNSFLPAIAVSTARVLIAVSIVIVTGTVLLLASVYSDYIDIFTSDVLFVLTYGIPGILWVFLILIWFGINGISPILLIALLSSPHFFISVKEGMANLDQGIIEVGEMFGTDELKIMRHVILPQLYPSFIAGIRSTLSVGWRVVVVAEFFTATSGFGYQVKQAFTLYDSVTVAAWAVIILTFLLVIDNLLRHAYNRLHQRYAHED